MGAVCAFRASSIGGNCSSCHCRARRDVPPRSRPSRMRESSGRASRIAWSFSCRLAPPATATASQRCPAVAPNLAGYREIARREERGNDGTFFVSISDSKQKIRDTRQRCKDAPGRAAANSSCRARSEGDNPAMFLTPRDVELLTGRRRPGWQKRRLDDMGIPYLDRKDGTFAVLRIHVECMSRECVREPQVRRP
jgi:hypothetical protein